MTKKTKVLVAEKVARAVREKPAFAIGRWLAGRALDLNVSYQTERGVSLIGQTEVLLASAAGKDLRKNVQLVFTSPPFALNTKKKYNNLLGKEYKKWLKGYAKLFANLLTPDGSIVIEIGNAWEAGLPVMSTVALEALLEFKKAAGLHLCQEFIWHNPAKLPSPAQWVTVERIRVKDSFTRLWWLSKTPNPKADNRRVLTPYSASMRSLLKKQKYNAGRRPSGHVIGQTSFFSDHGGAVPPNVLTVPGEETSQSSVLVGSNTGNNLAYRAYCTENGLDPHPARMPLDLARFFINLCTEPGDVVVDPFAGSNTTGAAAEQLDRRWIAIEASESYARSGRGRFEVDPKLDGVRPDDGSKLD